MANDEITDYRLGSGFLRGEVNQCSPGQHGRQEPLKLGEIHLHQVCDFYCDEMERSTCAGNCAWPSECSKAKCDRKEQHSTLPETPSISWQQFQLDYQITFHRNNRSRLSSKGLFGFFLFPTALFKTNNNNNSIFADPVCAILKAATVVRRRRHQPSARICRFACGARSHDHKLCRVRFSKLR